MPTVKASIRTSQEDIDFLNAEAFTKIGSKAIALIKEQVQAGTDIEGKPFKPYSPDYAKKKGVAPSNVDLKVTGQMLSSIAQKATAENTTITPGVDYEGLVENLRPFLGIAPENLDEIDKVIIEVLDRAEKKAGTKQIGSGQTSIR
jgi:hypothetical protein